MFTPDQAVDRMIVTQTGGTSGSTASLQFVHPDLGTLRISLDGTNVLIAVPTNDVVPSLQTTCNLAQPDWTTIAAKAIPGTITVPISTHHQQFFRLIY